MNRLEYWSVLGVFMMVESMVLSKRLKIERIHWSMIFKTNVYSFETGLVSLTFHGIGKEIGTAITGWLFTVQGTTATLCGFSIVTMVVLGIWIAYIRMAKHLDNYIKVSESEAENEDEV